VNKDKCTKYEKPFETNDDNIKLVIQKINDIYYSNNHNKTNKRLNKKIFNKNMLVEYNYLTNNRVGYINFHDYSQSQTRDGTQNCAYQKCPFCVKQQMHWFCLDCQILKRCWNREDVIFHIKNDHSHLWQTIFGKVINKLNLSEYKNKIPLDMIAWINKLYWILEPTYMYIGKTNNYVYQNSLNLKCTNCQQFITAQTTKQGIPKTYLMKTKILDCNSFAPIACVMYRCQTCQRYFKNDQSAWVLRPKLNLQQEQFIIYNKKRDIRIVRDGTYYYTNEMIQQLWFLTKKLTTLSTIYGMILCNYLNRLISIWRNYNFDIDIIMLKLLIHKLLPTINTLGKLIQLITIKQTVLFKYRYNWSVFYFINVKSLIFDQTYKLVSNIRLNDKQIDVGCFTLLTDNNLLLYCTLLNQKSEGHKNLLLHLPWFLEKILRYTKTSVIQQPNYCIAFISDHLENNKYLGKKCLDLLIQKYGNTITNIWGETIVLSELYPKMKNIQDLLHHLIRIKKDNITSKKIWDHTVWFKNISRILDSCYNQSDKTQLKYKTKIISPYIFDQKNRKSNSFIQKCGAILNQILILFNPKYNITFKQELKQEICQNTDYAEMKVYLNKGFDNLHYHLYIYWLSQFFFEKRDYMKSWEMKINKKFIKMPQTSIPNLSMIHILQFINPNKINNEMLYPLIDGNPEAYFYLVKYSTKFFSKFRYLTQDDIDDLPKKHETPLGNKKKTIKRIKLMLQDQYKIDGVVNHSIMNGRFGFTRGSIVNEQNHKEFNRMLSNLPNCSLLNVMLKTNIKMINSVITHVTSPKYKNKWPIKFWDFFTNVLMKDFEQVKFNNELFVNDIKDEYKYKEKIIQMGNDMTKKRKNKLNSTKYGELRNDIIKEILARNLEWNKTNIILLQQSINLYVSYSDLLNLLVVLDGVQIQLTEEEIKQLYARDKESSQNYGNFVEKTYPTPNSIPDFPVEDTEEEYDKLNNILITNEKVNIIKKRKLTPNNAHILYEIEDDEEIIAPNVNSRKRKHLG